MYILALFICPLSCSPTNLSTPPPIPIPFLPKPSCPKSCQYKAPPTVHALTGNGFPVLFVTKATWTTLSRDVMTSYNLLSILPPLCFQGSRDSTLSVRSTNQRRSPSHVVKSYDKRHRFKVCKFIMTSYYPNQKLYTIVLNCASMATLDCFHYNKNTLKGFIGS